jgi:hypothetical protein
MWSPQQSNAEQPTGCPTKPGLVDRQRLGTSPDAFKVSYQLSNETTGNQIGALHNPGFDGQFCFHPNAV